MRPFPLKILLCALAVSSLWAGEPIGSPGPPYNPLPNGKAPFRMIYSNDTTNIFTCPSPWRPRPDIPFSAKMIEETVKEAAVKGMDAQMIQPGTGWVAWWKSKKLPFTRQLDWFKKEYGKETYVGDFVDYMVNRNGDVVGDFLEACRKYNQACFVSYRLNDLHHLREGLDGNPGGNRAIYLSKFYLKNDEYRLGKGLGVVDIAHNWMIPEVVQEKFEFIDEIARTYDLDGIELDFLRSPNFFQTERHTKTPPTMAQRVQVMTQFISKVRKSIDESAKDGRRRWLCVRVPAEQADWIKVGLDPKAWRAAGVDMFNLSQSYNTSEQSDVALVRKLVPDATLYMELTQCAHRWKIDVNRKKLSENFRRSGFLVLENAARTAYARGADGVSYFNFVYYRGGHGSDPDHSGPAAEPPFAQLSALASPKTLTAPPYYYWAGDDRYAGWEQRITEEDAAPFAFTMDTVAPPRADMVMRMHLVFDGERMLREAYEGDDSTERGKIDVIINGKKLVQIPNEKQWKEFPFKTDFEGGLGWDYQYLAWKVPYGILKDGKNEVSVRLRKGSALWIRWVEIFNPKDIEK